MGSISILPRTFGNAEGIDQHDQDLLLRMARGSLKPIHGNVLGYFPSSPEGWRGTPRIC